MKIKMFFLASVFASVLLVNDSFAVTTPFGKETISGTEEWFYRSELYDYGILDGYINEQVFGDSIAHKIIVVTWSGIYVDENFNHLFNDPSQPGSGNTNPPDGTFVKNLHLYANFSRYSDRRTEPSPQLQNLLSSIPDTLLIINNAVDCDEQCVQNNGGVVKVSRFRIYTYRNNIPIKRNKRDQTLIKNVIITGKSGNNALSSIVKNAWYYENRNQYLIRSNLENENYDPIPEYNSAYPKVIKPTLFFDICCDNKCLYANKKGCVSITEATYNLNMVDTKYILPKVIFTDKKVAAAAFVYQKPDAAKLNANSGANFCNIVDKEIAICGTNKQSLHVYLPIYPTDYVAPTNICGYSGVITNALGIVSSECAIPRSIIVRVKDTINYNEDIRIGNFGGTCTNGCTDCECNCGEPADVCGIESNHGTVIIDHANAAPNYVGNVGNMPAILRKINCSL